MSYSADLRTRVIAYIKSGGKKSDASRTFGVSRWCIYDWLRRGDNLSSSHPGPKTSYKFNREELSEYLKNHPDATLKEMSASMGVCVTAIWNALQKMKITRKKNMAVH